MLTLTDSAVVKVRSLLADEEDGTFLRVAVRPGGCSGFSYEMYFDSTRGDGDVEGDFDGVQVVVDKSSSVLLDRATLDYRDGLDRPGFSIDNPDAQRTCGCGQSFS